MLTAAMAHAQTRAQSLQPSADCKPFEALRAPIELLTAKARQRQSWPATAGGADPAVFTQL